MLYIKNLSKTYLSTEGTQTVLNKLNLTLEQGASMAILGESGSGKSTLLNIIAGLEKPDRGLVRVNGLNVWSTLEHERARIRREHVSVIFQQYNLIPSLNIIENIEFHARLMNKLDVKFVNKVVKTLRLQNVLKKYPEQTSGGQQQRAAIARAIVSKPNLILADEPTGNLDEENTQRVIQMLTLMLTRSNTTLLVATHSQSLSTKLNSKLILSKGALK